MCGYRRHIVLQWLIRLLPHWTVAPTHVPFRLGRWILHVFFWISVFWFHFAHLESPLRLPEQTFAVTRKSRLKTDLKFIFAGLSDSRKTICVFVFEKTYSRSQEDQQQTKIKWKKVACSFWSLQTQSWICLEIIRKTDTSLYNHMSHTYKQVQQQRGNQGQHGKQVGNA